MGLFVITAVLILVRRIAGVYHNFTHRHDFETEEVVFALPSRFSKLQIVAIQRMWRCRSYITRDRVDGWQFLGAARLKSLELSKQDDPKPGRPYMATQQAIAYAMSNCKIQSAVIQRGQVIHVFEEQPVENFEEVNGGLVTRLVMRCEFGWVRKKAMGRCTVRVDGHYSNSDFNTLFIGKAETSRYYRLSRQSSIGRYLEVDKCIIPAFKLISKKQNALYSRLGEDSEKGGRSRHKVAAQAEFDGLAEDLGQVHEYLRTGAIVDPDDPFSANDDLVAVWRAVEPAEGSIEREALETAVGLASRKKKRKSDYQLQLHDVVEIVGKSAEVDVNVACADKHELQVVDPHTTAGATIGWISKQKEHKLHDEVRKVLHKSKLNVATAWALALAEGEDFRRMEQVFQKIEDFRNETEMVQDKTWHQHFPAKLRPAIYAWLAQAADKDADSLQWFMTELALAEGEQLRVVPHWWQVEHAFRKRIKCVEAPGDAESMRDTQRSTMSVKKPMRATTSGSSSASGRASPPGSGRVSSLAMAEVGGFNGYDSSSSDDDDDDGEGNPLRESRVLTANAPEGKQTPSCSVRLRAFAMVLIDSARESSVRVSLAFIVLVFAYGLTLYTVINYEMLRTEDVEGGCTISVCTICKSGVYPPFCLGPTVEKCRTAEPCCNTTAVLTSNMTSNMTGLIPRPHTILFNKVTIESRTTLEYIYLAELWALWVSVVILVLCVGLTKHGGCCSIESLRVGGALFVWGLLCTAPFFVYCFAKDESCPEKGFALVHDARYLLATLVGPFGVLLGGVIYIGLRWDPPPDKVEAIQRAALEA